MGRRCINVIQMFCVYWVSTARAGRRYRSQINVLLGHISSQFIANAD